MASDEERPTITSQVAQNSGKKVWWLCKKGHEWRTAIAKRSAGQGCPFCTSASSALELRILCELKWVFGDVQHRQRIDGVECDCFVPQFKLGIEIDSLYWHRNRLDKEVAKQRFLEARGVRLMRVRERGLHSIAKNDISYNRGENAVQITTNLLNAIAASTRLPLPLRKKIADYTLRQGIRNDEGFVSLLDTLPGPLPGKSLADLSPELAAEWNFAKNLRLTSADVSRSSNKVVWWKCAKGHEYQASPGTRTSGRNCPYCAGKRVSADNCLNKRNPRLAAEWHPTKNGSLGPSDVTVGSNKKVWWLCNKGHEWQKKVAARSQGYGCPYCTGQKVCQENSLAAKNPSLSSEWHPNRNHPLNSDDVMPNSLKEVWWLCHKGHEWIARIGSRNRGNGCPFCSNRQKLYLRCRQRG